MFKTNIVWFLIFFLIFSFYLVPIGFSEEEGFIIEDFEESVPEFVEEAPPVKKPIEKKTVKKQGPLDVRKRTYLRIAYGAHVFSGKSKFDEVLKDGNKWYRENADWQTDAYITPIISGITGGIEVRKGLRDNIMIGLSVQDVVGQSARRVTRKGSNKLITAARFDVTTTFINTYFYQPWQENLEYYYGLGVGVGSGVVQYSEEYNDMEYAQKVDDKAAGIQAFIGFDWIFADNFILETNLFYRGLELKSVGLSGTGLTLGLILAF